MTKNLHNSHVARNSRFLSFLKCVAYSLGGLFFFWKLLVVFAFASMVDPSLPQDERNMETLRRFFMANGLIQLLFIGLSFALAITCTIFALTSLYNTITGKSFTLRLSRLLSGVTIITISIIGIVIFLLF